MESLDVLLIYGFSVCGVGFVNDETVLPDCQLHVPTINVLTHCHCWPPFVLQYQRIAKCRFRRSTIRVDHANRAWSGQIPNLQLARFAYFAIPYFAIQEYGNIGILQYRNIGMVESFHPPTIPFFRSSHHSILFASIPVTSTKTSSNDGRSLRASVTSVPLSSIRRTSGPMRTGFGDSTRTAVSEIAWH